jgi:hypothetical protein
MSALPFAQPDRDINLNLSIALLVLEGLAVSNRGKNLLNAERLQLILFLIRHPTVLVSVCRSLGKEVISLDDSEAYSIASIALDIDQLFNSPYIKILIKGLSTKGLIGVSYRRADGFMFSLSQRGKEIAFKLSSEYFQRVREYVEALKELNSEPTRNLMQLTQQAMRENNE